MNEGCENCAYVSGLKDDVKELKEQVKRIDGRLIVLEKTDAAREMQMKSFSDILKRIEASVEKIAGRIEDIELKPVTIADKIKIAAITAIVSGFVGFVLSKIL